MHVTQHIHALKIPFTIPLSPEKHLDRFVYAFIVMVDEITLIDCVKEPYKSDLIHRIRNIIDPEKIDYIVVNHVEMDHSGCLPDMVELIKPEKVICSKMGHTASHPQTLSPG